MTRFSVFPSVFAVLACSAATSTPITQVVGTWGGDNAGLIVTDTDVHIHIGCTLGDAVGPINPDANGRFEANGTYNVDAYPVDRGIIHPATIHGTDHRTDDDADGLAHRYRAGVSPVTLIYGKEPQMGPCPICRVPKGMRERTTTGPVVTHT